MKNKLTLEVLAPYLPYGLRVQYKWESKITKVVEHRIGDFLGVRNGIQRVDILVNDLSNDPEWCNILTIKPILRPLSDLTKEINWGVQSYSFVDLLDIGDEGGFIYEFDSGNTKVIALLKSIAEYEIVHGINFLPYPVVKLMIEYHFDVFGLIAAGLAINLNEI